MGATLARAYAQLSENVSGRIDAQRQLLPAPRHEAGFHQPTADQVDAFGGLAHRVEELTRRKDVTRTRRVGGGFNAGACGDATTPRGRGPCRGSTVRARISGEAFLTPPGQLYDVVVDAIREETGIAPELSTSGGTSDGRFLIQLCPVVDFGLPNATMHKVGESAAVEDVHELSRIYERIVSKLLA